MNAYSVSGGIAPLIPDPAQDAGTADTRDICNKIKIILYAVNVWCYSVRKVLYSDCFKHKRLHKPIFWNKQKMRIRFNSYGNRLLA